MTANSLNVPALTMPRRHPLGAASWVLLILWLAGSAAGFWFMEISDWRSFKPADAAGAFDAVDASQVERWYRSNIGVEPRAGAAAKFTLIHLYNPACRCNRFTEPHLKRLIERYQARGVRFLAAPARAYAATAKTPFELPAIRSEDGALARAGVNSSPAALIFDADGRLLYYGPYSDSAWCGSAGALVEPVLDRAFSGLAPVMGLRASRGCFCEW